MNQILETLTPFILAAVIAALGFAAQWFRTKTMEIAKTSELIREATVQNKVMLEKNTKLTEIIERNSNGMSERLAQIAASSAFAAGRIKGMDDVGAELTPSDQAELDEFEKGNVSIKLKDTGV